MKTRTINNLNLEDVPLLKVGDEEIVSGQRYSAEKSFTNSGWHSHNMAVIGSIDSGLMGMRTQSESMVFSYGMIAFIPANLPHNEEGLGTEVIGWYLCLPKNRIGFMPNRICILESSELLLALCKRIVSWGEIKEKSETQKRLVTTFLDELHASKEIEHLRVPLPQHSGLHIVAKRIINDPNDMNTIDYWAKVAAMSRRSFTRYFYEETGLTFILWRQRVKLFAALERLSAGQAVTRVSLDLGYQNVSTFSALFRKQFGTTPSRYVRAKRK